MLEEDLKEARRLLYVCRDLVGGPGSGGLLAHIDRRLLDVSVRMHRQKQLAPYERIMETAVHEQLVAGEDILGPIQALRGVGRRYGSMALQES